MDPTTSAATAPAHPASAGGSEFPWLVERFPIAAARERWLDFLLLEHETLPLPLEFEREADALLVRRRLPPGRPVRDGRVPQDLVAQLLLQAACALAFFQACGFWLDEEDLVGAHWDREAGRARLWLARSPAALRREGPGPPPTGVLSALLDRLARRGGRIGDTKARALAERLGAPDATLRRAEFAVAAVLRSFPSLGDAAGARTRCRAVGYAGGFLRDLAARTLFESGRAILDGRRARRFLPRDTALAPGAVLGLEPVPPSASEGSRRLRELARADASGGRSVWIVGALERWDRLSRRALETAARFLPHEVEIRQVPFVAPPPRLPDEWRREIFVPCGSLPAALRFYEWLADAVRDDPAGARDVARECLSSADWAAFVSDPTGQAPLPSRSAPPEVPAQAWTAAEREVLTRLALREEAAAPAEVAKTCGRSGLAALTRLARRGLVVESPSGWRLTASGRRGAASGPEAAFLCRRWAERETDPAHRIEWLLRAGAARQAIEAAERWYRQSAPRPAEPWFELSARFSAAGVEMPPWLGRIEAEREIAGGRPAEARALLERVAGSAGAAEEDRRAARLREAEVCARVEDPSEAGRRAAAWLRAFPQAPRDEAVRALRLEAAGLARDGRHMPALQRLDEADRLAAVLGDSARLENALARASVLSRGGRWEEEAKLFEVWRERALRMPEEVAAHFLSQEALGLCDRRKFAEAAARLEEALAVLRDDPAERARISIDLAATLYHAGRTDRCAALLEEAAALASSAGRRDLLRIARSNRVELWVARAEWGPASDAIEDLLRGAREEADPLWELVALHQRGRAALRRGMLERAAEDNAHARGLAADLGDRLEIGELWLEEGDRLLYEGDLDLARRAWERAAADPPDRCDTEGLAASRLQELDASRNGGPAAGAREALAARLCRGDYEAAETAARWQALHPGAGVAPELAARAERILRERGGGALADRVFGSRAPAAAATIPAEDLRGLREALARGLAGEESSESLQALGLSGLVVADEQDREILRLGRLPDGGATRRLEAGAVQYRLTVPREAREELAEAAALVAETLLFRLPSAPAAEGHIQGWRRFGIVTDDASMEEPYRRLARFAAQPVTVLVRGESGSGKEAVARAVHALSPRAAGPFVAINVPAIPAALLESELFGHVRGAFTGAERDRVGLFEEAARGTIFFDEIGDLEPALQSKLLRTLQDREIRRLGENRSRRVDVRIVSATARDLAREVEAGRFREDLFYRLHVAVIALPPLRERGRDVLRLARHFLEVFGREYGREPLRLSPEAARTLSAHAWPGNVRELQNAMAHAAALSDSDGLIGLAHLPETIRASKAPSPTESYRSRLDAHRKGMISEALERAGGNRSLAARALGLSRQALRYLMKELNVRVPPVRAHGAPRS